MKHKRIINDFWHDNYATVDERNVGGFCCLCGNTGVIDTTHTARTPMGVLIGRRVLCLCPNGRAMQNQGFKVDK